MKRKIIFTLLMNLMVLSGFSQTNLTGVLKDKEGSPVVGATVIEKGTNNGTFSDENGSFVLSYESNDAVIVIQMLGYATKEIKTEGRTSLEVVMEDENYRLSGVEIVGTRNLNRTSTETPVAVEIIPIAQVTNAVGQLDMNQVLQFVAPSFNSNRQSGADGADHIDPATLRLILQGKFTF